MDNFKLLFTKLSSSSKKSLNISKNVLEARVEIQNKILSLNVLNYHVIMLLEGMKYIISEIKR